jgi:hypothetical protein
MPSPFKAKEVTPVQKLGYYWIRLDDTTKGYFEQLYKKYPQDVSEILAGEALLPAGPCNTLQDWVDGKGGGEALTLMSFDSVYIDIREMKAEPEQVGSDQPFKVVWAGEAKADFPDREDRLVILDHDGTEVRNMTLTYPAIKAGAVKEEIDCSPLPNGTYTASLTINVDGTDHGTELTAQGIRSLGNASIYVGESEDAYIARLSPIIADIQGKVGEITLTERFGPGNAQAIRDLALLAVDVDRPGRANDPGPRTEVATDLADVAGRLPTFDALRPDEEVLRAAAWAPLRERLRGMMTLVTIDEIRSFQGRMLDWLNSYLAAYQS